ncbi:MAG: hypothetical protein ACP5MV_00580 [Candidatus Parvarchaeum sp.]
MESKDNLKQIAQNVLDASYKIYSDVSLINSSLFRAASTLGVELPDVPKIDLAETKEKVKSSTLTHKVNPTEDLSPGKKISLFGIDKKLKMQQESTEKEVVAQPVLKEAKNTAVSREQKINKIAHELPSGPNYKPGELSEEKITVAQPGTKTDTKVSIEEKEAKLNKIQSAMPSKNIVSKENENVIQPLEAVSPAGELSSQSELQKKIFETTNFGKNASKNAEDYNEISNNPLNKLLMLIKEKHSITTSQAAQSLNVSKDLIEKWAKILSQNSLIRVKYQLMGDMILEG